MSALLSHRLKSVQYARWGFGKIMVITQVSKVRTSDPSGFAWAGLRKFQNVENVAQKLEAIHKVPAKFKDAVRKQALQIRYCLIQAREYFTAGDDKVCAPILRSARTFNINFLPESN
jgi:hypothetical protein